MTKLTHHYHHDHCHHNYITLQHERGDPSSCRKFSVVHRQITSPRREQTGARGEEGHATSPKFGGHTTAEPCTDKAEDIFLAHQALHADSSVLAFDSDRMSDHDPSSGDGEEEPPSPEPAQHPVNPQWKPSSSGIRPPHPAGLKNTNPAASTGSPSFNKAVSAHSNEGRRVQGQTSTSLPAEKVFPIQVGSEVFRLSGASVSSDGPSYFTQWFEDQIRQNEETGGVRTLYIDRDPETFRDIARHLQGYYVKPRDGPHFVRLFADAQFYSLPRLISQLFESEIFIQIGEQHFQIPKDIFSDPGNSPNFFSLGFAVFFSTPSEVFPGLDRRGLLRPPPINPPYVPGRSAETFTQLLHLLRGYSLEIRNETHRQELLRDCRYFHLRGLEQRIIAHDISYNLEREKSEICLRLNDLKPSGISYHPDDVDTATSTPAETGWVHYARPFVDEQSYELIVEINGESTVLDLDEMRVDFHGKTKARVASLFQVIANKMGLASSQPLGLIMLSGGSSKRPPSPGHSPLSEDKVRVRFEAVADIVLNNTPLELDWDSEKGRHMRAGSTKRMSGDEDIEDMALIEESSKQTTQSKQVVQRNTQRGGSDAAKNSRIQPPSSLQPIAPNDFQPPQKKRKVESTQQQFGRWTIRNGQWRLRVEQSTDAGKGKYEIVFVAVKIDAYTNEKARNARRPFLG